MSIGRITLRRRARAWRLTLPRIRRGDAVSPRRRRLFIVLTAVLGLLLFGAWMLFRDSSFVAVEHVTITGEAGPDAPAIRSALRSAARNMTTLDVQLGQLNRSVSSFAEVKGLRVSAHFPHRLVIQVVERLPVGVIQIGARRIAVAGDGTILRGLSVTSPLPVLPMTVPPVGQRLTEASVAGDLAVLAAAPYRLLSRVSQVTSLAGHGLVAQIRGGPSIYFGAASTLAAKWIAASEVLADPSSSGAAYIDVTDAQHPAAGEGSGTSSASSVAQGSSQTSTIGTTQGG